jgi:hypothetical protein
MGYLALLFCASNIPPNISNTLRYRETKISCAKWLSQRLGEKNLEQIRNLKFNQHGMFKLASFLKNEKIDATSVEAKREKEDGWLQCWNRDR